MNCKPGDIAIVVHPMGSGRLVSVLYAAPMTRFTLPDGMAHLPANPNEWVVEMLGAPIRAQVGRGGERLARYGAIRDCWLKPLRGDLTGDEAREPADLGVVI